MAAGGEQGGTWQPEMREAACPAGCRREEGRGAPRGRQQGEARLRPRAGGQPAPPARRRTGPRGNGGSAAHRLHRAAGGALPPLVHPGGGGGCGRVALANRTARSCSIPPPHPLPEQPIGRRGCHFGSRPPASRPRPFPSRATGQRGCRSARSPPPIGGGGRAEGR